MQIQCSNCKRTIDSTCQNSGEMVGPLIIECCHCGAQTTASGLWFIAEGSDPVKTVGVDHATMEDLMKRPEGLVTDRYGPPMRERIYPDGSYSASNLEDVGKSHGLHFLEQMPFQP